MARMTMRECLCIMYGHTLHTHTYTHTHTPTLDARTCPPPPTDTLTDLSVIKPSAYLMLLQSEPVPDVPPPFETCTHSKRRAPSWLRNLCFVHWQRFQNPLSACVNLGKDPSEGVRTAEANFEGYHVNRQSFCRHSYTLEHISQTFFFFIPVQPSPRFTGLYHFFKQPKDHK